MRRQGPSRISDIEWTDKMKSELLYINEKSMREYRSPHPPVYSGSGNKVGVQQLMLRKWTDMGYSKLHLTSQDLQDQCWKLRVEEIVSNIISAHITSRHTIIMIYCNHWLVRTLGA